MADLTPLIAGSVAGCLATLPMTLAMEAMHRQLPPEEQYPLPPREITDELARDVGVDSALDEQSRSRAALIAHFAFGAAMGALYGGLGSRLPVPEPARGALLGVGVWAGNYLGLLPSVGLLTSATRHPVQRSALMISAHVVWGVATGLLLRAAKRGVHSLEGRGPDHIHERFGRT